MKVDLFPEDLTGYVLLTQFQQMRNDRDGMIASIRKIYDLDPSQQERLRELGGLYEAKGETGEALRYYTQYAERFPDRQEAFLSIGNLQRRQGDHAKARENYDKALLLAPAEMAPQLALARLDRDLGNFDAARRQYEDALAAARTDQDRLLVLDGLSDFYQFRGQMNRSLEYFEQALATSEKTGPALVVSFTRLNSVGAYARAGKADAAAQLQARVAAQLQPPFNALSPLGELQLQLELERPDDAERAATQLEQSIQTLGFQHLEHNVVAARARIAELRGKCDQAIPLYEQQRKLTPSDASILMSVGRCYRKLGQTTRSIEQLQAWLRVVPHHARGNYELGLSYLAAGDRAKALEHLRRAEQTWYEADATVREAADAKRKIKEIGG
jgi:tetratricopeptide (TPR) repeat protein